MLPDSISSHLSLPVVAAPMFLISGPRLVIECCRNGVMGTFPALNQRTTEGLGQWLQEIETALDESRERGEVVAPYGVNLIVHRTNPRVEQDLAMCVKHKVPVVITSLGAVSEVVDAVHSYGGLVFHDVIKRRHAEKAAEAGVDGLICVSAGAGGHAGLLNPMPFVADIRSFFDGVILLAGAISSGRDVASATQIGADLAYMGTRFINTTESQADDDYRQMIIDSSFTDIVYTAAISGVDANFLRQSLEAAGITEDMWTQKAKIDLGKELNTEARAWKTIWSAGQGVATINDTKPVAELVAALKKDFLSAIADQQALAMRYV